MTMAFQRFTGGDAALLLIDHQVGTMPASRTMAAP